MTEVDVNSQKLATEKDVKALQSTTNRVETPYWYFDANIYDAGAQQIINPSDKLITKAAANSYGFCVNEYDTTHNLSGITYTENQLVQLRDLIPDRGNYIDLSYKFTFSKDIGNLTAIASGNSTTVSSWLNSQTTSNTAVYYNISSIDWILTTSNGINLSNSNNYVWMDDSLNDGNKLFSLSRLGSYGFYINYNNLLENNSSQTIELPLYLGSTGSSPVPIGCTLNIGSSGGTLTYGSQLIYLHLHIMGYNNYRYVFNIPLYNLQLQQWNNLYEPRPYTPTLVSKSLTNT